MTPWAARLAVVSLCAGAAFAAGPRQAVPTPPVSPLPASRQAPPQPQASQQAPQPPVFRAGVRLVRVDVTVTGKGDKPVADLTAADFEVTEDGAPQKVEQLQFLRLTGQRPDGDESSLEIRSQEQAEAEAARDDVRVFAIFLDDYHVDKAPQITIPIRRALSDFINRLWPSDLVAIMDPLTTLSALEFTRSKPKLLHIVSSFEGRQGELFPVKSVMEEAQWMRGDVRRVRAEVTLSALGALTMKLAGLKEGRKSIIFVSQGPPTYLGSRDGNLQDRMREIVQAANRGNVTINVLDPVGLSMEMRLGDKGTLYQLAGETGGRTIMNTNDPSGGLQRTLDDASAYYVLGYTPTRTEDDGKYHKISVKVKRPGTHVTARQGYWAPSSKELEAAAAASAKVLEPRVAGALKSLAQQEPGKRPVDVWMGASRTADGRRQLTVTWEPVDPPAPTPVTQLDIELSATNGPASTSLVRHVAAVRAGKTEGARAVFDLSPGSATLNFTARSADGGIVDHWSQGVTVAETPPAGLQMATPRMYRARSLQEVRAIQATPDPTPGATRQYSRSDRVLVNVECYPATPGAPVEFSAHVQTREGQELTSLPVPPLENGIARFELPVGSFGQGTYILRLQARDATGEVEQNVAFRVAR